MVSYEPLPDVSLTEVQPGTTLDDALPFFDNYSWRSFIALNWPAMAGAANRGKPDTTKSFRDKDEPRVWMTFKSRSEIFQPMGDAPAPWASYDGQNPCGKGFFNDKETLAAFTAFTDFNMNRFLEKVGNPLVAQNRTYVRYEVRVNPQGFDSIVKNKWYLFDHLPSPQQNESFDIGSTHVKAAWRILTKRDTPDIRKRYYTIKGAHVFDVASRKCTPQDIALVGLHIVTKTPDRKQWIWSTFEHVDNVPCLTCGPTLPTRMPYSFYDRRKPSQLIPAIEPPPVTGSNVSKNPKPMQVVRLSPIQHKTMEMNRAYWNLPEIKGSVWENYMLEMTQWPALTESGSTVITPSCGPPQSANCQSTLSNTTMETYFQGNGYSCMDCHGRSQTRGRDFVWFVTLSAFQPGVLTPADLFAGKVDTKPQPDNRFLTDPAVSELLQIFEAARAR
jgi:hypothetical protein